jgi:hypothetical protein
MVFERKCFIDPADIIAVQRECKCGATVTIPVERLGSDRWTASVANPCAQCGESSGLQMGTEETDAFLRFNIYLKEISKFLKGRGFTYRLEVKCPKEETR